MAVTATQIDGNNVALVYAGGSATANVFSLNTTTGAVTSNYLSSDWCRILSANAVKLFSVTSSAQRQTVQFLDRLVALGSLDGATITSTASVASGIATLVVSVSTNTTVLVQLPHSIFGAASLGQSVPATGGGGGGSVVPADLGLVLWTGDIDSAVAAGYLVGVDPATGALVLANPSGLPSVACIGVYTVDSSANPCVRTSGEIDAYGGPFTPGAIVYMGATITPPFGGIAVELSPTTPGSFRQVVGYGTSDGKLFVQTGFVEVVS
jgi:hypothetical protein